MVGSKRASITFAAGPRSDIGARPIRSAEKSVLAWFRDWNDNG